jgi:hypothetical protein
MFIHWCRQGYPIRDRMIEEQSQFLNIPPFFTGLTYYNPTWIKTFALQRNQALHQKIKSENDTYHISTICSRSLCCVTSLTTQLLANFSHPHLLACKRCRSRTRRCQNSPCRTLSVTILSKVCFSRPSFRIWSIVLVSRFNSLPMYLSLSHMITMSRPGPLHLLGVNGKKAWPILDTLPHIQRDLACTQATE